MAVIGSAYIAVHAITKGFEREVKKALREMQPAVEASGERAGKTFTKGFKSQTKTSLDNFDPLKGNKNFEGIGERLGNQFSRGFKKATKESFDGFDPLRGGKVKETFGNAGGRASRAFAQGFKQSLRDELSDFDPLRGTKGVYGQAGSRASKAFVADFKRDIRLALKDLADDFDKFGDRAGQQFATGFRRGAKKLKVDLDDIGRRGDRASKRLSAGFSAWRQEAMAAYDVFATLLTVGYFVGPAISAVVGAISALVSGLVALVAQVGAAVPALIVLPGIFAAIAQAAVTAKLAFGGIGKAVQELSKQKAGGGADQSRQIALAERSLARVLESNREALVRANDNLTKAEERLTEARIEAAESLQQLNFDAEDAAISEKRAAIQLEKARETLARVQDLPPNSRARREAELAYAEADLNLRRAKDRNSDLAKATEEANAKGVEGSREVVAATEALQNAVDSKAKTERDALRSQLDAEEALAEAKKRSAAAGGAGGTTEFDKLSKEAQEFARFIVGLQDEIKKLRDAAGQELFPRLQIAIQNLVDNLFPALIPLIQESGRALGDAAIDFSKMVTEAENLKDLETVMETNTYVIENMGKVTGNLYDVMLSLLAAADPLIRRFTDWLVVLTEGWAASRDAKQASGELTDTFNKAGDAAAQLGRVFGNIGGALMNIGQAASGPGSGGQKLLDLFEDSTARFEEFTDKLLKDGSLEKFFLDVADNVNSISKLLVDIVKEFLKLGDDKGVGEFAESLRPVVANFGEIASRVTEASPLIADFLTKLSALLLKLTETESIEAFFGVLNGALDVLNDIFGNETVQKIFLFIAPILGAVKAVRLLSKFGNFMVNVFRGPFAKVLTILEKVAGFVAKVKLGAIFGTGSSGPAAAGAIIVAKFALVAGALFMMWKNSEKFREAVIELGKALWDKLKGAFDSIKEAIDDVLASFGGASGAAGGLSEVFKTLGDFVARYIIPIIGSALMRAINIAKNAIIVFIKTVAAIVKVFQFVWEFVRGIFALFTGDMDGVKKHFGKSLGALVDAFKFAFSAIWGVVKVVFEAIYLVIEPIVNFIKGIIEKIIGFFKYLYNVLVGNSIIPDIVNAIMSWFKKAWEFIKVIVDFIVEAFKIAWNVISTVVDFAWNNIIKPIFEAFKTVFELVWSGIQLYFETVWAVISTAIPFVWNNVIKPIFEAFKTVFEAVWSGIKTVFDRIWGAIQTAFKLGVSAIETAIKVVKTTWELLSTGMKWAYENVIKPVVIDPFKRAIENVKTTIDALKTAFDLVKTGITTAWTIIKTTALDKFKDALDGIKTVIDGLKTAFNGLKDGIISAFKEAFNKIADIWNTTVGSLRFEVPSWVPFMGGNGWSVPDIPKFARGGFVSRPTMGLVGEAGPELILPLRPDLRRRREELLKLSGISSEASSGASFNINVYPSPGMNESELASMVSRELALQFRKGAI